MIKKILIGLLVITVIGFFIPESGTTPTNPPIKKIPFPSEIISLNHVPYSKNIRSFEALVINNPEDLLTADSAQIEEFFKRLAKKRVVSDLCLYSDQLSYQAQYNTSVAEANPEAIKGYIGCFENEELSYGPYLSK